jgi:uncharacterized protein
MGNALLFLGLGLVAGVLTTLAGQGGGLFLLLALSAVLGPHAALAITAPALLLGNTHRAMLFRRSVDRGIAVRVAAGAVPGALAGGLVAGALPPWALEVALVGMTAVAVARALGWISFTLPRSALPVAGLFVGGMTGTTGGAGVLFAPVLFASGLSGVAFIGTSSVIAVATHVARVIAYGASGLFSRDLAVATVLVTLAIFSGNTAGERIRDRLTAGVTVGLEYGVLVTCVALSLAGLR